MVPCPNCYIRYRFEPELAGLAICCRGCGFVFRVEDYPAVPGAGELDGGAIPGRWILRYPSGRQFGPVSVDLVREWIREGRTDPGCLVCPEDGAEWYGIGDVFHEAGDYMPEASPLDPVPGPAEWVPASGIVSLLPEAEDADHAMRRNHSSALLRLEKEARRASGYIRMKESCLMSLTEGDLPRSTAAHTLLTADYATVAAFTGPGSGEFYCVVPWSGLGRLPHEFFSILPGHLPGALALRRDSEEECVNGVWIGTSGAEPDALSSAADDAQEDMISGGEWRWFSRRRDFTMVLVWGMQAVPLGPEKFAHLVQSASRHRPGQEFGLLWYLEKQSAFYRFSRRLETSGDSTPQVLFSSVAGRILTHCAVVP